MLKPSVTLILSILFIYTNAQELEKVKNTFRGTRFVNAQSANLADNGDLLLQIQHRFGDISGGAYEFFGLDQASMRIGFEYGFGDNFNLGIGRSTYMKTFDTFGKIRIIQQNENFPLSISVNAGGSVPSIRNFFQEEYDNFPDKVSVNTQVHIATTIKNVGIQLSPGFLKTGYLPAENDNLLFFTLGIGGSIKISKKVSANIEYLNPFTSELNGKNPLSLGVDLDTGGHLFQLVISNSQRLFDQALYTQTIGDWTKGNLFFGFNLVREFNLKYSE
ncbi:MAG: hypothetical protein HQ522_21700 [Bacteroidetes bacterium]|nr:hypothetical protein [Bacteroidota bacterium]